MELKLNHVRLHALALWLLNINSSLLIKNFLERTWIQNILMPFRNYLLHFILHDLLCGSLTTNFFQVIRTYENVRLFQNTNLDLQLHIFKINNFNTGHICSFQGLTKSYPKWYQMEPTQTHHMKTKLNEVDSRHLVSLHIMSLVQTQYQLVQSLSLMHSYLKLLRNQHREL